jgi:hypothetical protein
MVHNLRFPFGPYTDVAVIQQPDEALPLQWPQVGLEFIQEGFIFSGITDKDADGHGALSSDVFLINGLAMSCDRIALIICASSSADK